MLELIWTLFMFTAWGFGLGWYFGSTRAAARAVPLALGGGDN